MIDVVVVVYLASYSSSWSNEVIRAVFICATLHFCHMYINMKCYLLYESKLHLILSVCQFGWKSWIYKPFAKCFYTFIPVFKIFKALKNRGRLNISEIFVCQICTWYDVHVVYMMWATSIVGPLRKYLYMYCINRIH